MDTFLKDLYQDHLEKQAKSDLSSLYKHLSPSELEVLLGLQKTAVAGPTCPSCPTGAPAKDAKVTDKAVPKKAGPAERPKAAAVKVAADAPGAAPAVPLMQRMKSGLGNMSRGWHQAGEALHSSHLAGPETAKAVGTGFLQRPGAALNIMRNKELSLANRVGRAGRVILPHAGLLAGVAYLGAKLLGGGQQQPQQKVVYAQAGYLKMAAAAVDGAPVVIRRHAAKLAAAKLLLTCK